MLPRSKRITTTKDFENVKSQGKLIQSESFSLAYFKRGDNENSRFGFIVSTKISKNATARNKAKRALREAIRQNFSYINNGFDCVFLAKPIIVRKYTDQLMHEVAEVLEEAGVKK